MRLDKYIANTGVASRKEASKAAKKGLITVNGKTVKDVSVHIDENNVKVVFCGEELKWEQYQYIMLNKPAGFISSTEKSDDTVMALLPEKCTKNEMFPCGRLDKDTVGLLIITNDGPLAHKLLSPKHHAKKKYYYNCEPDIDESKAMILKSGVDIGGYVTKCAHVEMISGAEGFITLTEGKFHQIKRMFEKVGSNITYLKRVSFGGINLDENLDEGQWRYLNEDELNVLKNASDQ